MTPPAWQRQAMAMKQRDGKLTYVGLSAHLLGDAQVLGVEGGRRQPPPLRHPTPQRGRVDAHRRDAAASLTKGYTYSQSQSQRTSADTTAPGHTQGAAMPPLHAEAVLRHALHCGGKQLCVGPHIFQGRSLAGLGGVQGGHICAEEGGQLMGRRRLDRAHQLLVRRHLLLRDLHQQSKSSADLHNTCPWTWVPELSTTVKRAAAGTFHVIRGRN